MPFSVFPRCQCVYTPQAGRTPALQQNWQSSRKKHNIKWTPCSQWCSVLTYLGWWRYTVEVCTPVVVGGGTYLAEVFTLTLVGGGTQWKCVPLFLLVEVLSWGEFPYLGWWRYLVEVCTPTWVDGGTQLCHHHRSSHFALPKSSCSKNWNLIFWEQTERKLTIYIRNILDIKDIWIF